MLHQVRRPFLLVSSNNQPHLGHSPTRSSGPSWSSRTASAAKGAAPRSAGVALVKWTCMRFAAVFAAGLATNRKRHLRLVTGQERAVRFVDRFAGEHPGPELLQPHRVLSIESHRL